MYRKPQQPLLFVTFGVIVMSLFLAVSILSTATPGVAAEASPEGTTADSPFVTTYPLGNEGAPRNLIQVGDDLWFTAPGINAIGRLIVDTADYTFYSIPTANSDPYDLVWDGESIWFTERAGNKIGKLDIDTGDIVEYPVPTLNSQPTGIAATADGLIWFVERVGNKLASFDPSNTQFTEIPYDRANALLEDIAVSQNGNQIWFTAPGAGRLLVYEPGFEGFGVYPTSTPGATYTPSQVVIDNLGDPWISTKNGLIGRLALSTVGYFRWYRVGGTSSEIDGLVWMREGTQNKLWFTESNTGMAGQLVTKADGDTVQNWRLPIVEEGGMPFGLVAQADGTVWVADSGNDLLLRWSPPYLYSVYLPIIMRAE